MQCIRSSLARMSWKPLLTILQPKIFALKEGCLANEDAMLLLQTSSLKSIIDRFNHMDTHRMDDIRAAIHAEVYERKKELLKNGGADADI